MAGGTRNLDKMTPEDIEEKVAALSPAWAQQYIRRLESLTRALYDQLIEARSWIAGDYATSLGDSGPDSPFVTASLGEMPPAPASQAQPSMWTPAGITPPDGEYSTVRVVDGPPEMNPVADIDQKFEIRFADFYQVRYGAHDTTGGMRLLVVQGDGPIVIHPIGQDTVLISRGGHVQEQR